MFYPIPGLLDESEAEVGRLIADAKAHGWTMKVGRFDAFMNSVPSSAWFGATRSAIYPSDRQVYGQGATRLHSARDCHAKIHEAPR
jgi:hypothetical protein